MADAPKTTTPPLLKAKRMSHVAFLKQYEAALASQSWEQVSPCFAEEAVVLFSEGTFVGKGEIERAFRRTFDLIKDETYSIEDTLWVEVRDTLALCTYTFKWSGHVGGQLRSGQGRGSSLLVLEGTSWKIKHEHLGPAAA